MEYDFLVFIGRFQPFHIQHKRNIDIALQKATDVLVLVGSAGKPRSVRNPWTFEERATFIRSCFPVDESRIFIDPLRDHAYNDEAWILQVQDIVADHIQSIRRHRGKDYQPKVGLVGASKDHTSYYLKLFPQWNHIDTGYMDEIHATGIRKMFFEDDVEKHQVYGNLLPPTVAEMLFNHFRKSEEYKQIKRESNFVRDYKKQWASAPYPPIFSTVDAVVIQSGHILLIQRRDEPGKGLYALPGGFVNPDEKIEDAVIRELREEAKIKVPEQVLRGSIVSRDIFDDPHRSDRGRTITTAYLMRLRDDTKLPKVRGGDDAKKAFWLPIGELPEDKMFEDHFHIANKMLGL